MKPNLPIDGKSLALSIVMGMLMSIVTYGNGHVTGKITAVIDGNTVEVATDDNEVIKILLAHIDSPELSQEFGNEAKEYLEKIVLKKKVVVQFEGKDRHGNHLAVVMVNGKVDVRIELLKRGLAWTSEKDPAKHLEAYRLEAKSKGKGLWSQENPTPPWTYRREQSMLKAKSA